MTHLEIITLAYDRCGILYVVREGENDEYELKEGTPPQWQYLFLCNRYTKEYHRVENLDILLADKKFIEFKDGLIASY
jgi:hypothetical protein